MLLSLVLLLPAAAQPAAVAPQPVDVAPPVAKVVPHRLERHGHVRVDNYYWLQQRDNPEVVSYLTAENAFTDATLAHTKALQEALFEEIKGRIKQSDTTVPYRLDGYYYYTRYVEGKQYPVYARKKGSLEAAEEVMLDANVLAEGHDYFSVGARPVSPGGRLLAFSADTMGRRIYTLRFKDLATGQLLPDVVSRVTGNVVWAGDDRTVFYTRQDPVTLRAYRVYRHTLGTDPAADVLVYEEADSTFNLRLAKSKSKRYVFIVAGQTLSTEYRYLDADDPTGTFRTVLPRERNHEYDVEHAGDRFYLLTNDRAKNFRLVSMPVGGGRAEWQEVIPHRDDVLLTGFEVFKDHLVLAERKDGLTQLRIRPWSGEGEHYLAFDEPAYEAYLGPNPEFDTPLLRYTYTSLTTPATTYDYDMRARQRTLLKREEVLGGFDRENYVTERLMVPARDGVKVPVSLVYRRGTPLDGTSPLLLYGYGSYGYSEAADFNPAMLSLLDRGFVYAVAHVRGGQEMGRAWYESGKLLQKKNTFTDFIDVADQLVARKYADPERLFALGGSAGGLLMGAVINMRPERFTGVVAAVPFVDVVTTMLDDTIPLTTFEYDEWGNPNDKAYYDYMLSYSPYDNVEAKAYPHLLVTTGLHDSQVQYWEPAKWVAKLRAMKTDDHRLLLRTNMDAGHGGASGRYERYRETALEFAFLLDLAGATSVEVETN